MYVMAENNAACGPALVFCPGVYYNVHTYFWTIPQGRFGKRTEKKFLLSFVLPHRQEARTG